MADGLGSGTACSAALRVSLHGVCQAENGAAETQPRAVMALFAMLLVQLPLGKGGRFGRGATTNTARLDFAAVSEVAVKEQKSLIRILSSWIVVLLQGCVISYRRNSL